MLSFKDYVMCRQVDRSIHETAMLFKQLRVEPTRFLLNYINEQFLNEEDQAAQAAAPPAAPAAPAQAPGMWDKVKGGLKSMWGKMTGQGDHYKTALQALQALSQQLGQNQSAAQVKGEIDKIAQTLTQQQQAVTAAMQPQGQAPAPAAAPPGGPAAAPPGGPAAAPPGGATPPVQTPPAQ